VPDSVTLEDARRVISAAESKAEEVGQSMNIAVVDAGGNLVSHVRMDRAWIGSIDISINKAFTSRAFDISTKDLAEPSQPGGQFYGIHVSNGGASGSSPVASRLLGRRRGGWSHRCERWLRRTRPNGSGGWGRGVLNSHQASRPGSRTLRPRLFFFSPLFTELRRRGQPVEKVGIELIATPNRARNAPKAVCLVPFGARSWVKAATKDVFQQPDVFYEVRLETDRKVLDVLVA